MIIANEIHLLDDHTDLNIHFAYKGYEVSTNTNIPYTYKRKSNPLGLIEQKLSDRSKESVQQDYFRELVIHMPIDKLIENDDDDSDDDIFASDYAEENLETGRAAPVKIKRSGEHCHGARHLPAALPFHPGRGCLWVAENGL